MNNKTNKTRSKRYFGMSILQLVVLACLACLAISLGGGGVFLIASNLNSETETPDLPSSQTPSPEPTETLTPTPTTTVIPTPKPTTYKDSIPSGWVQFRDDSYFGYEIWFPPEYTPVNARGKLEEEIKAYKDSGDTETAQSLSENLEEEAAHYVLWMADTLPTTLPYQTNISVAKYSLDRKKLANFIDARIQAFPVSTRLMERRSYEIGAYEAERLWLESGLSNNSLGQSLYFIRTGSDVWVITCQTHLNEFYIRLTTFDQIANTFRTVNP